MGMGIGMKMCIGNPSPQTGPLYGCTCTAVPVGLALHGEHVAVGWAMRVHSGMGVGACAAL